jgi:hypothetical protein
MSYLTAEQREHYLLNGWLLCDDVLPISVEELQSEVDLVAALTNPEVLHHHEMTDFGAKLARTENFVPFSPVLDHLLQSSKVAEIAGELLGEEAFLYKEKVNYKLIGGAGFRPHQDKPAYPFVEQVLSVMIAVDDSTIENGCLDVVSARHQVLLEQDDRGCLTTAEVNDMNWQPMPLRAGQTLFFHALTPHRSGSNNSKRDRRALYPTYNGASEGRLREKYYEAKLKAFENPSDFDGVRLSLIGDFEGRPV